MRLSPERLVLTVVQLRCNGGKSKQTYNNVKRCGTSSNWKRSPGGMKKDPREVYFAKRLEERDQLVERLQRQVASLQKERVAANFDEEIEVTRNLDNDAKRNISRLNKKQTKVASIPSKNSKGSSVESPCDS
jgi:hypothetical protein